MARIVVIGAELGGLPSAYELKAIPNSKISSSKTLTASGVYNS